MDIQVGLIDHESIVDNGVGQGAALSFEAGQSHLSRA